MIFAIRDDDTNFFTQPEEISHAYGQVWDICPPTLSVVTDMKGNWPYWNELIFQQGHAIDWAAWMADNTPHPIHENGSLVGFLKEGIASKRLGASFHAVYHRNDESVKERSNNYVRGAEFFTEEDKADLLRQKKAYLEGLLESRIDVFTPPQNLLSLKGYKAVVEAGFNIVSPGISNLRKIRTVKGVLAAGRYYWHRKVKGESYYPFVMDFGSHKEVVTHFPFYPTTVLADYIAAFEAVRRVDGVFILSTHYNEFSRKMRHSSGVTLREDFLRFFDHVMKHASGIRFCTLSEVFA